MVNIETLKELPLFQDLTISELEKIKNIAVQKKYRTEEVIIKENVKGEELYIIIGGSVRISKMIKDAEKQTFAILKGGNFFGELSLLDGRAHSATVEAVEESEILIINKNDFDKLLETDPQGGFKVMKKIIIEISSLLRQMNDKFTDMIGYMWK